MIIPVCCPAPLLQSSLICMLELPGQIHSSFLSMCNKAFASLAVQCEGAVHCYLLNSCVAPQTTTPSGGERGRGLHGIWNYLEACSDADIISRVSLFSNVPGSSVLLLQPVLPPWCTVRKLILWKWVQIRNKLSLTRKSVLIALLCHSQMQLF